MGDARMDAGGQKYGDRNGLREAFESVLGNDRELAHHEFTVRSLARAAGGRSRLGRICRVYADLARTALEVVAVSAGVVGGLA